MRRHDLLFRTALMVMLLGVVCASGDRRLPALRGDDEADGPRAGRLRTALCAEAQKDADSLRERYGTRLSAEDRDALADLFASLPGLLCSREHMSATVHFALEGYLKPNANSQVRAMLNLLAVLATEASAGREEAMEAYLFLRVLADPARLCMALMPLVEQGKLPDSVCFAEHGWVWPIMELPMPDLQVFAGKSAEPYVRTYRDFGLYVAYLLSSGRSSELSPRHRRLFEHMCRTDPNKAVKAFATLAVMRPGRYRASLINARQLGDLKEAVEAAIWFKAEGPIGRPALQEALKRLRPLIDPEKTPGWFLRLYAAEVLSQNPVLDDAEGFRRQALQRLRNDPDPSVRLAAERGLKTLQ